MNLPNVLIGYSGYVGGTLRKQRAFDALYRSTNIGEIRGGRFEMVVCAGAPAQKWLANREPEADRQKIEGLISHLDSLSCNTFVLISTVDVFQQPIGVNEKSIVDESELHPYGLNRRLLEKFIEQRFDKCLIVRLPGLVGPSLRKNVIFDFLNSNNLHLIDSRGVFQFYPTVNLWHDIQIALHAGLKLIHLTAAPISVGEISAQGFGRPFEQTLAHPTACYDLRTCYAQLFDAQGEYQYSQRETLQAVRTYAQSEPTQKAQEGASA